MLIRMKRHITGTRDGVEWPQVGDTIDVPDHEAEDLFWAGHAEPADVPRSEAGEDAAGNDDAAPADDADETPAADAVTEDAPAKPKRARAAKKAAS